MRCMRNQKVPRGGRKGGIGGVLGQRSSRDTNLCELSGHLMKREAYQTSLPRLDGFLGASRGLEVHGLLRSTTPWWVSRGR
ncbi:hypothetical protein SBV1_100013 [Verrucomicrobia bacterium]|nr:hypothetical protein SBV1_100013 [Verrucomicrobiota bacterium]